jgi:hypothetical protein
MLCVFCRERSHTKATCAHPNTVMIQRSIIEVIMETYAASLPRSLTRQEFIEANAIILDCKYTVLDLKKVFVYLKNRVETRATDTGNKRDLIMVIVLLSAQLFNYTFSSLGNTPEHTLNENRLTTGISRVVREILHPTVGGLQPRASVPVQGQRPAQPYHTPAPTHRASAETVPTPQYRLLARPPFQTPRPTVPHIIIPPANLAQQMNEEAARRPAPPTYTVHKTDRPCEESGTCAICLEDLNNKTYVYLNCSHEFCKTCIKNCIRTRYIKCSLCRADITEIHTQEPTVTYSI